MDKAKLQLQQMGQPMETPPPSGAGLVKQFPNDKMIFAEHEPGEDLYIIQQSHTKFTCRQALYKNGKRLTRIIKDAFLQIALFL